MRSVVALTTFIMVGTAPAAAIESYANELQLGEEERIMMHDMNFLDKETSRKASASKAGGERSVSDESEGSSNDASFGDLAAPLPGPREENRTDQGETSPKSAADSSFDELQLGEEERIMMLDMTFLDQERNRKASASESRDDDSLVAASKGIPKASISVDESYKKDQNRGDRTDGQETRPKNAADSEWNELQLGEEERVMMLDMNFLEQEMGRKAAANEVAGERSIPRSTRESSTGSNLRGVVHGKSEPAKSKDGEIRQEEEPKQIKAKLLRGRQ